MTSGLGLTKMMGAGKPPTVTEVPPKESGKGTVKTESSPEAKLSPKIETNMPPASAPPGRSLAHVFNLQESTIKLLGHLHHDSVVALGGFTKLPFKSFNLTITLSQLALQVIYLLLECIN